MGESFPLSGSPRQDHADTPSPHALQHSDVDNNDDDSDDERFQAGDMSPALSFASDSSHSASHTGILLCNSWLYFLCQINSQS